MIDIHNKHTSMKISISLPAVKKHIGKVCIAGAVVISVLLAAFPFARLTLGFIDSLQFLYFVLLVGGVAGTFALYRAKNQPWIFIVASSAALLNYFFAFVLASSLGAYVTSLVLIAVLVWNIFLDRAPDAPAGGFPQD